jgi:hypothetical protein
MTKKEAISLLVDLRSLISEPDVKREREALDLAIAALKAQPNYKRLGAKGGKATFKRFGKKGMKKFGKEGGRPSTVLEEARKLGVTIPEGVSRQRAWQIVQEAKKAK